MSLCIYKLCEVVIRSLKLAISVVVCDTDDDDT